MEKPRQERPAGIRAWVFPLAAALVATVGALLAAELGLRAYHHLRGTYRLTEEAAEARRNSIWTRSDDPELIFVHRPDYHKDGIRFTEAHGILRPEDAAEEKPRGTFRIGLFGDSVGAGLTLAYDDRFPTLLEKQLTSSLGQPVEVLNFSVNGYKTVQEARLLEASGAAFDFDLLIIAYCMNDVANSLTPTEWFVDAPPPRSYLWEAVASRLGMTSAAREPYVPVIGPDSARSAYKYWHELYEPGSVGWRSVLEGFDRIAWFASERSCPVLLVIFPFFLPAGWYAGGVEPLHRQVAWAAEKRGFAVLDLLPVFAAYDVDEVRDDPEDIFHPNVRGNRIAARAIEESVLGLLGLAPTAPLPSPPPARPH